MSLEDYERGRADGEHYDKEAWKTRLEQLNQTIAERDKYREALERAARLAEQEPGSLVGQVVREALVGR